MKTRIVLTAMALMAAAPAWAHEGDHTHMGSAAVLRHILTEPDHLIMLALLIALVAAPFVQAALRRARR